MSWIGIGAGIGLTERGVSSGPGQAITFFLGILCVPVLPGIAIAIWAPGHTYSITVFTYTVLIGVSVLCLLYALLSEKHPTATIPVCLLSCILAFLVGLNAVAAFDIGGKYAVIERKRGISRSYDLDAVKLTPLAKSYGLNHSRDGVGCRPSGAFRKPIDNSLSECSHTRLEVRPDVKSGMHSWLIDRSVLYGIPLLIINIIAVIIGVMRESTESSRKKGVVK